MLNGIQRGAQLSKCGAYRFTLTRTWDDRPPLFSFEAYIMDNSANDPRIEDEQ